MMAITTKFELGQVVMTPGAIDSLDQEQIIGLLARHANGDWGDILCEDDKQANEDALVDGDTILSAYMVDGTKIYVITECDRSVTTILLPEEY